MTDRRSLPAPLRGIIPPLLTPLRSRDELDHDGLSRLIEHVITGGVTGVFILGTTGEGPALSYRLRHELVELTTELVAGRVPVLVGVTDTSYVETLELAQRADQAGAAAIVAAPPYYFPLSQPIVQRYFRQLADDSPRPLFLYNMPACTKTAVELSTVEALLPHPNIAGIKDSSGDMDYFRHLLRLRAARPDWSVLIGPEHLLADAVPLGADGGVSGGANLHPRLFVDLAAAARRPDTDRVTALQAQVLQLGRLYELGDPSASVTRSLKSALALLGLCGDTLTDPLEPLGPGDHDALRACLAALDITSPLAIPHHT